MIDIHCHILPGVDDGAKDTQETEKMLRIAYNEGIRCIIATPHYHGGMKPEVWKKRRAALASTIAMAKEISPDLHIISGAEIYYSQEAVEDLMMGDVWTLNASKYVLIEFATYVEFTYIRQAVQTLQYNGYLPILAHIERYDALLIEENVEELVRMGAYIQVNAGSVIGRDGRDIKKYLLQLLKKRYIHFIGTDAHGSAHRRPLMKKCAAYIEKKTDKTYRRQVCLENARKIVRREYIDE